MPRPGRLLWMETVVHTRSGQVQTYLGRGDDQQTYISMRWLEPGEKFVAYFEGDDIIGPRDDYISTRAVRRRFPRVGRNRRFLETLESTSRRVARERGWR
jgi:hypothetical protein